MKIEKLKQLAENLCRKSPTLCGDMEIMHNDDPEQVLFGYTNGWATTFWAGKSSFHAPTINGIKFCHVYCVDGVPDKESEETRTHFAPTAEAALCAAMVECYKRELDANLGVDVE